MMNIRLTGQRVQTETALVYTYEVSPFKVIIASFLLGRFFYGNNLLSLVAAERFRQQ